MKIAWLGFGLMGSRMVTHLTSTYEVHGFNRSFNKVDMFSSVLTPHRSIQSCIQGADIIIMMLSTPDVVEHIAYHDLFPLINKGTIIIDMSTNLPSLTTTLYQGAKQRGAHWIDAPVSGGLQGALNATLSIMIGGDEPIVEKVLPILKLMGSKVLYCGASGQGQHTKMANQIAVANNLAGLLESMEYARHTHLNLDDVIALLGQGAASSWQIVHNGPLLLQHDMKPGFIFAHFLKDLRCVMHEAKLRSLHLPVVETITNMVESLLSDENQELSTLVLAHYYRQHNPRI